MNEMEDLLVKAIHKKDLTSAETLLSRKSFFGFGGKVIDVNAISPPLLCYTCSVIGKSKESTELLLQHGANVNAKGEHGFTALHYAASTRNPDLIELLIAHGADVSARTDKGDTPLHKAAGASLNAVEILLRHGADPNVRGYSRKTPMHLTGTSDDHEATIRVLLDAGANIHLHNDDDGTLIHAYASSTPDEAICTFLIEQGAEFDIPRIHNGATPLHEAVEAYTEMFRSDMTTNRSGPEWTAKKLAIIQILVNAGADVHRLDRKGRSPVSMAASRPELQAILERRPPIG